MKPGGQEVIENQPIFFTWRGAALSGTKVDGEFPGGELPKKTVDERRNQQRGSQVKKETWGLFFSISFCDPSTDRWLAIGRSRFGLRSVAPCWPCYFVSMATDFNGSQSQPFSRGQNRAKLFIVSLTSSKWPDDEANNFDLDMISKNLRMSDHDLFNVINNQSWLLPVDLIKVNRIS